ncbi:MAG: hypothetical protein JSU73_01945 [candidate division WOR-3 bacterium]|nr:MAG: hypothetical protein JSU73_01945 [candidate division WOR-3 bacterium]
MHRRLLLMAAVSLLLVAGICPNRTPPDPQWEPGQFEPIGGKDFDLTSDLTVRSIVGGNDEIENPAAEYPLKLLVFNETDSRVDTQLPEGLIFRPTNDPELEYDYCVLVKPYNLTVPPSQDTTVFLPTYNCDEDKFEADDEEIYYESDIQLWEKGFTDIFEILADKALATLDDFDVVQEAIYEYTYTQNLSDSLIQVLEALP